MRLLVGLGNPGSRYVWTRHNLGFLALDRVVRAAGAAWGPVRGDGVLARGEWEGATLVFMKPMTYMNLSGRAVSRFSVENAIEPSDILVYLDEMALPLGTIRLRPGGRSAGHRGLESIIESLGVEGVPRMRLGIGPEKPPPDTAAFVLEPFDEDERPLVEDVLDRAVAATRMLLRDGMDKTMSVFNQGKKEAAT